jgi:hypothetical protein
MATTSEGVAPTVTVADGSNDGDDCRPLYRNACDDNDGFINDSR